MLGFKIKERKGKENGMIKKIKMMWSSNTSLYIYIPMVNCLESKNY